MLEAATTNTAISSGEILLDQSISRAEESLQVELDKRTGVTHEEEFHIPSNLDFYYGEIRQALTFQASEISIRKPVVDRLKETGELDSGEDVRSLDNGISVRLRVVGLMEEAEGVDLKPLEDAVTLTIEKLTESRKYEVSGRWFPYEVKLRQAGAENLFFIIDNDNSIFSPIDQSNEDTINQSKDALMQLANETITYI